MKKIILIAGLFFCSLTQAQDGIAFTTNDEAPITDGQVFIHTTTDEATAKMLLHVKNNTDATFLFKVRVDEVTGNPEAGMDMNLQFCFSQLCYFSIVPNHIYPGNPVSLEPGASNDPTDHFWNAYPGDGTNPVIYRFTFIQVDEDGNQLAELISFTYKYMPTAGVTDISTLQNMGINVNNTVVKSQLNIDATTNATMQLVNINGQIVKTAAIINGSQSLDLSALSAATYIARFTTEDNKTSTIRIVKN